MKIYIDLFNPPSNYTSNANTITQSKGTNMLRKQINKGSKFKNYLKINLLIITIPIISYTALYLWKYYKKTKKLIDDYLDSYIKRLKLKIKSIREKLQAEKIKNSNNNLSIDLDIYSFIDLNTCLDIIYLKTEISNRILYLKNNELYSNKLQAIQEDVFEEYYCYYNEIKKKNKTNDSEAIRIIEENFNISYKKIEEKLNEEKEFIFELNGFIMSKDFYTREKYNNQNKFSLYHFLNIDGILSLFSFLNVFNKEERKQITEYSFLNLNAEQDRNMNYKKKVNNINEAFDPNDLLNISVETERDKFTVPRKQIGLYCSAFLDFSNVFINKLEEILNRNDIEIIDQINVSKELKNLTKCLLSNANDLIKEKYKMNSKNIFPVIIQNECFKDERITYYFDELKSYLIKFQICLLDS